MSCVIFTAPTRRQAWLALSPCDVIDGQSAAWGSVAEMKVFNAHDGAGLKLASIMGIRTGLITGRDSPATARRAREASMEFVIQGQAKKLEAYKAILVRAGVTDSEVAYVGDDLPDLPLLERAGLAVAVANAVLEVKRVAHYVTLARGGQGTGDQGTGIRDQGSGNRMGRCSRKEKADPPGQPRRTQGDCLVSAGGEEGYSLSTCIMASVCAWFDFGESAAREGGLPRGWNGAVR